MRGRPAAAILAYAVNDLLSGRDTQEILTWIDGAPALLPFAVCCQLAGVEADRTRLRLRQAAQDPEATGTRSGCCVGACGRREFAKAQGR